MVNREGFWWSKYEPHLPAPHAKKRPWKGQADFLAALRKVESGLHGQHFKGGSKCRVCGCVNGSSEYKAEFMKSTWEWPSGFAHYVKAHNVRPSLAFQEFILAAAAASTKLKV